MRVIKRGALVRFWQLHPDAQASLESWYAVVRKANWKTPVEMKQVYGNADLGGERFSSPEVSTGYVAKSAGGSSVDKQVGRFEPFCHFSGAGGPFLLQDHYLNYVEV
jgi:hypothetical protein